MLLFLLSMGMVPRIFSSIEPDDTVSGQRFFVEISGDVVSPGVYSFKDPPTIGAVLTRGGADCPVESRVLPVDEVVRKSGKRLVYERSGETEKISETQMSAFFRVTLGIPLCINREGLSGLTAIPGIGVKTAGRIIENRDQRGGFSDLVELLDIKGIGPSLYERLCAYSVLGEIE